MGRKAHLVGSIPGASATEAMEAALSRLGPHLLTLSDGETGQRAWWIGACIGNLGSNPDVEVSGGGQHDFSSYDDVPQYRIREGATLSAANLEAWDAADPNRKMALEETPWLELARGGKDAGHGLTNVLDPRVAKAEPGLGSRSPCRSTPTPA